MPSGRRGLLAAVLLAPWIAFAAVRLFGLDEWTPTIVMVSFTPAVAILSVVPIFVALALRQWTVALAGVVVAAALLATITGRVVGSDEQPARGEDPLVVMTANLKFGNASPDAIVSLVVRNHVDVLSLQELTPGAVAALDAAGIREALPSRLLEARSGAGGSGIMSATAIVARGRDPVGAAQPEGEIEVDGVGPLRIKAVHPPPPIHQSNVAAWKARIGRLPGPLAGTLPRILAGDFNATLDHSELRELLDRGFQDAAENTGDGLTPTYPRRRLRPGITIDHVLIPDAFGFDVLSTSVHSLPGSDHRAVIAVIRVVSS